MNTRSICTSISSIPVEMQRGRYRAPLQPGFSAQMRAESIAEAAYKG